MSNDETGRTPSRSLFDRHVRAERAMWLARGAKSRMILEADRRIARAEESERIAYHRLYLSVPCAYCHAEVGAECDLGALNSTVTRHTARAADCMTAHHA